jgi:hypothetical protein
MSSGVYVRAKTSDGRYASVLAEKLDEESFRLFVLRAITNNGGVVHVKPQNHDEHGGIAAYSTPLTKAEADAP